MHHPTRLKLNDMNPHFMCVLCDGYLVDATTIIECLHSFCRTCIVRYLENSRFCPVCDVQVHKTKPLQSIRSDKTLQDIVYKLVPGLYQNEMKRRKELYSEHPEAVSGCSPEDRGEGADHRFIYAPDETISLSLEYLNETNRDLSESSENKPADGEEKDPQKRYLQCPAAISISHLKKFISMKFGLPPAYTVEIIHHDDILSDDYTLMDMAYIYAWKRAGPMQFFYNITRRVVKRVKTVHAVERQQLPSIAEEPSSSENAATCDLAPEETSEPKAKLQKLDSEQQASNSSDLQLEDSSRKLEIKPDTIAEATPPIQVQEPSSAGAPKPISADIAIPEVSSSRSEHPVDPTPGPVPQVSVAAPKVVCTTATVIPTTNGVTLKFVQCHAPPAADPKNRGAKKPAGKRSAGRTPRNKGNTARTPLVRLAPYPPPSCCPPPVTCLTTAPMTHLTPIAVRNLVAPTVTGLPPLMTTLRPAMNTLCSSTMSSPLVATHSPFGGYSPHTAASFIQQTANTSTPVMSPHFPGLTATGFVTAAETAVTNLRPATSAASLNVLPVQTLPSMQSKLPVPTSESSQPQVYIEAPIKPVMIQASSSTLATCGTPNPPMVSSSQSSEAPQVSDAVTSSVTPSISVSTTTPSVTVAEDTSVLSTTEKSEIGVVNPPITVPCSVRLCPNAVPKPMTDDQTQPPITMSNVCSVTTSEPEPVAAVAEKKSPPNQLPELPESSPTPKATDKPVANGIKSPQSKSPLKDSLAFPRTFTIEKKSDDFPLKITVKNTISAEFSDNDDLGCQPDLVVDERNSSDNEDDDALRKKITAIAEKDDEADVTDDTEADSGRASDISSQARSSCDDDVGSPMMSVDSVSSTVTSSSTTTFTSHLPPFTTPSSVSIVAAEEPSHRPSSKSIGLDHVISNIYRNHEQRKDTFGALDLSTCTRKPGDEAPRSRQKAVANPPVLDVKHRQQTCLSAPPSKPHTACVPSPKHPTSLHIAAHHGLMTASTAGLVKPMQLPIPYSTMAFPCQSRPTSSPSMVGKPFNSSMMVPNAHQNFAPMVPHQCVNASFQGWSPVTAASMQGRNTPTPSTRKNVSSPVLNANKFAAVPKQPCPSPSAGGGQHRKAIADCVSKSPSKNHNNLDFITKYSPGDRNGANLNVDCLGKSPSHRNGANVDCGNATKSPSGRSSGMASPSPHRKPSPNPVATAPSKPVTSKAMTSHLVSCAASTSAASSTTSSASYKPSQHAATSPSASYKSSHHSAVSSSAPYKPSQPTMPINNKKSNSHKNHGYRLYRNLAVINPDPNGYRQKIVIKNLDFRPNNHQPQDFSRS